MAEERRRVWCTSCNDNVMGTRPAIDRTFYLILTACTGAIGFVATTAVRPDVARAVRFLLPALTAAIGLTAWTLRELRHAMVPRSWMCTRCGSRRVLAERSFSAPSTDEEPHYDGPGRFKIVGIERETHDDVEMFIEAATPANAKTKAELTGLVVTEVVRLE